jgi:hypothetical protein
MLALLFASLCTLQDPTPAKPAPAAPAAPANPAAPAASTTPKPVAAWDDKAAKAAVDEWSKVPKTASMADKNRGLDRLAEGSNKALVPPLARVIETEKSVVLRKRAAELLANQPAMDAGKEIRRLMKNGKVAAQPTVMAELIRGFARTTYETAHWSELEKLFETEFHPDRAPLQEAILELVVAKKEKGAVGLLVRHIDEPKPADPDSPTNPGPEYWEARWKSWAIWKGKVRDALFAVTGQRFSTEAEASAWLKKNKL